MKHGRRAILCSAFETGQNRKQKSLLKTNPMKKTSLEGRSLAVLEWLLGGPVFCWRTQHYHGTKSSMPNTCLGTGRQPSERMNKGKKEQE